MKSNFLLLLLGLLILGCQSTDNVAAGAAVEDRTLAEPIAGSGGDGELIRLVRDHIQAMEEEDLAGSMRIASKDMAGYSGNRLFTQQLFDLYDLAYEIEAIEVVEQRDDAAQVAFVHTVKKISGAEFFDQRHYILLHFTREGEEWKVIEREVKSTEYL